MSLLCLGALGAAPLIAVAAPPGADVASNTPQATAVRAHLVEHRPAATIVGLDRATVAAAAAGHAGLRVEQVALGLDETVDLVLEPFSITGPRTRFVLGATGAEVPGFDPAQVTLLRGHVDGDAESHVFLALTPRTVTGRIELGGREHQITSAPGGGIELGPDQVAVFPRPAGIGPLLEVPMCGVGPAPLPPAPAAAAGSGPSPSMVTIEMAIETDYEYFALFGDAVAAADYVAMLYGAVSDIYIRDVNARLELTFVRLWDTPADLFDDPDPLGPFVDYWNANMGAVNRDAAQFLTGRRNLPYGGVAYVEALCSDFAYSVTGWVLGALPNLDVPSNSQWDVIVTAHELGHNAGTFHTHDYGIDNCASGDVQRGTIMSYCHTTPGGNANIDLRFHGQIQPNIEAHLAAVDCLFTDCNANGIDDTIDLLSASPDDNGNGVPDECEDCNGNGTLDPQDIALGESDDDNGNGIPDECEPDCNGNDLPDDLDIALGAEDLYFNGIPDLCEADCDANGTADYNQIQLDMSLDLDRNAVLDSCQDCDGDLITDFDALAGANNLWVASSFDNVLSQYHGISGVLVQETGPGDLSSPRDLLIRGDGHILVASLDDRVAEFDADGNFVGDLVTAASAGLSEPQAMVFSPHSGTLLVASYGSNSVIEYDASSGAAIGAFVPAFSGGLLAPTGLAFGPNGNLFVASEIDQVYEYDGLTGAFVGIFVSDGDNGGLTNPHGILFKPDGNLLVASTSTSEILEYDGTTGASLGRWDHGGLASGFWQLQFPWDLVLGPDGNVLVTSGVGNAAVHMYDVDTGSFKRSFYVLAAAGPLLAPSGLAFVPGEGFDCNLNFVPDACDITSGYSSDNNGNGVPDECEAVAGDVDGDGLVSVTDLLILLGTWGPCPDPCPPSCAADIDGDCAVGVTDLLIMLGNWGA